MSNKNLFDLTGKVALVTGASRGIGESIARTLAHYGAHVIVSSRKIDGCEAVANSIREDGGSAEAFACHIGEMDQIEAVWEHIAKVHGKLDILVNNAAVTDSGGRDASAIDIATWDRVMNVNVRGTWLMTAACTPALRASARCWKTCP